MLRAFEQRAAPGTFWRRLNRLRGWLRSNSLWRQIKRRGRTDRAGSSISHALPQQALNLVRVSVRIRNTLMLPWRRGAIRLLEKTPENCLRLPFLLALFPDAQIIYLVRDGRSNVNSLIEGWKQPHLFPGYQVPERLTIPGYTRGRWAFTLIPGWRDLINSPLEEVCAWQWVRCNEAVLTHREQTQVPYLTVRYEDLVSDPATVLPRITDFVGIDLECVAHYAQRLPQINVVSTPERLKWQRQNPQGIRRVLPIIEPMMERLGYDSSSW
jgi:hypothetical protein